MVPSIYWEWQPRCLSLWWDFCNVVWFRVVFSFSWGILFYFFFNLRMFEDVHFRYSQIFISFLFSKRSDFSLFVCSSVICCYYYYRCSPSKSFTSALTDSLSLESKWQQVSSGLQGSSQFLADLNNAVVWMVLILSLISNSFGPLSKAFGDRSRNANCSRY